MKGKKKCTEKKTLSLHRDSSFTAKKEKGEDCKVTLKPEGDITGPPREDKIIPDDLKEPLPGKLTPDPSTPDDRLRTPGPIKLYSSEARAECDVEGTEGKVVEIPSGEFTSLFYFSLVLSITDAVLDYIARQGLEDEIASRIHDRSLTPEELRNMTGMTLKQGRELLEAAYAMQDQLDEYARGSARAHLVCLYWNTEQSVTCTDPNMEQGEGAVYEASVPAHVFSSSYSIEAANEAARNVAESKLICFYSNDEVEVDCLTRPDKVGNSMEPVPNDEFEVYPGKGVRVGHVKVEAGQYQSTEGKDAANALAQEQAYAQLVCWYPNDPVHAACEDPDARNAGISSSVPAKPANPETGEKGQWVDIPEGFITSEYSREEATREAQLLADSLIECCYTNDPISVQCEPQEVVLPDGTKGVLYPDPEKSTMEFYIPGGTYTSCYSKEDADRLAQEAIQGMLNCVYCNQRIMPTCVPDWILRGVESKAITLPLGEVITDGEHTITAKELPPEATVGVDEKAFCDPDAQMVEDIADAAARVPAGGNEGGCIYLSDPVYATCSGVDPVTGETHEAGVVHYLVNSAGEPYIFYTMYPPGVCLSESLSRPNLGEYITNPAGMFSAVGSNDSANQKSLDLALSQIYCVWENVLTHGICGHETYAQSFCDSIWYASNGMMENKERLTGWSNLESNPIVFPPGYITYVGKGNDEAEAFSYIWRYIERYVRSMIICIYGNLEVYAECEETGIELIDECGSYKYTNAGTAGVVQANMIYTTSPEEADKIAAELANGIKSCEENTVMDWGVTFPEVNIPEIPPIPPIPTVPIPTVPIPPTPSSSPFISSLPESPPLPSSAPYKPGPPGPGPGPGGGYSSPTTPGPNVPPEKPCCYSECPFHDGGCTPIPRNQNAIFDEFKPIERNLDRMITSVVPDMVRLRERAKKLEQRLNELLEQVNG